jgi:hypothetical protein
MPMLTGVAFAAAVLGGARAGADSPPAQNAAPPQGGAAETAQGNPKADPAAYALLKRAHDARQVLPADFPGFESQLVFSTNGKAVNGTVTYRRGAEPLIAIEGANDDDRAWVKDQVQSIIGHRRGGDFARGDGRHALSFGTEPDNSFGKLIELNDGMQSSYRVRGTNVTEVTRTGGPVRFTVTVLETGEADPGKSLPQHFIVAYRDKKTLDLQKVEGFRDDYTQIGTYWLPVSRTVVTFDDHITPGTRIIRFKNIKLLAAAGDGQ